MMPVIQTGMILNDVRIWCVRRRTDDGTAEILPVDPLLSQHFDMTSGRKIFMFASQSVHFRWYSCLNVVQAVTDAALTVVQLHR
jgi:hypothetical protein